jgi:hypothetical protein
MVSGLAQPQDHIAMGKNNWNQPAKVDTCRKYLLD